MPPTTNIWRAPLRRLTIGLIVVVVAGAFEALAVATVLPVTSAQLDGLALYGWTFSAFMLTNLVGITLGGRQSDLTGPAAPFFAGTLLFVAGLAVSGFAPSMVVIVAGRALQGLGAGLLSSTAYAAIALAYSVELQPRMLATMSSAWVVPGMIGPALAGIIASHSSWRWVFLGLIPLPLIAGMLALPALRPLRPATPAVSGERRLLRAVQLGAGASAALGSLALRPWELALPLLLTSTAAALHALRRLLPPGTLTARRGLPAAVAAMALLNFAFFGTEAFLPLALSRVRGASVWLSGAVLTSAALTWTLGAWLSVRLGPRLGRRVVMMLGLVTLAGGLASTAALLLPAVPPVSAIVTWGLTGLGMGLAFTTCSAAILESATPGQEGFAAASLQLAQVLGTAVATGAGGLLVAARFAGDPPARGIAAVDLLMLGAIGLAGFTALRLPSGSARAP